MTRVGLILIFGILISSNLLGQLAKGDRTFAWQVDMAEDNDYGAAVANATSGCMESAHLFSTWSTIEQSAGNFDQSFISSFFDVINAYYPALGVEVELQIAPVNTNVLELPSDLLTTPLNNPIVINRFKILLDTLFTHIPDVTLSALNIGNESDIFFGTNATGYNEFKAFLDSVSPYAKQLYFNLHGTDLKVGTTLTFDGLVDPTRGPLCQGLNIGRDIIATTYYPLNPDFTMESPSVAAGDFAQLVAAYPSTAIPIYLVECGYSSSTTCNSSETLQAQFYEAVFDAWDTHYDNIKYLTVFKSNDWSQADVDTISAYYGFSSIEFKEYLRTLGVRNWAGIGSKKLAYDQILCELADRNWCTVSCPNLSIESSSTTEYARIYPNPTNDGFVMEFENTAEVPNEVTITTDSGVHVTTFQYTSDSKLISIDGLASGIYIVTVSQSNVIKSAQRVLVE